MAPKRSPAIAVLWSIAAIAAGCTPTLDFDSVSRGGPKDGGTTQSDGASAGDAPISDGGAAFSCATLSPAPTFCDDFDGKSIADLWDPKVEESAVVATDTVSFLSPPNALLSKTEAVTATGQARAVLPKAFTLFDGKPIQLIVNFDMRIEAFDNTGKVMIAFAVLFGPDSSFNQIVLNLKANGDAVVAQVVENAQGPGEDANGYELHGPFAKRPKVNDWSHVRMELDVTNPTGVGNLISFDLDGVPQLSAAKLTIPLKGATPRIELGVGYVEPPAQSWAIRYDNFTADISAR